MWCARSERAASKHRRTRPGKLLTRSAAPQPATCKSRDEKVVCGAGGCIDQIVDKVAPQLPTDYPCSLSESYMSNCLTPFVGPLASTGANLQALLKCDSAASMERIRAKNIIKCKADATTVTAAAPAPAKA